jgi:hypothetical protein
MPAQVEIQVEIVAGLTGNIVGGPLVYLKTESLQQAATNDTVADTWHA